MRTALVTGASGGLGRALALGLARAGHDVGVHYRSDADGAAATVTGVEHAGRRGVALHADLDVGPPADLDAACEDLLDRCSAALGGDPDVVVLSAFPQHLVPWADLDAAAWDAYHRAGLRPTAVLLERSTARMAAGGAALVVGSIEGWRAAPAHAPYAVAKAAVHHLVAAAAHELGPRGVRVCGVAPGLVDRDGPRGRLAGRRGPLPRGERTRPPGGGGGGRRGRRVPRLPGRVRHHRHGARRRRRLVRLPGLVTRPARPLGDTPPVPCVTPATHRR